MDAAELSTEKQAEFCDILSQFWSMHNCLLWVMGNPFQRLVGSDLFSFVQNIHKVTSFLQQSIVANNTMDQLCEALHLWKEITPMLTLLKYDNEEDYYSKYDAFVTAVKRFYVCGSKTFITKDPSNVGGEETFYLHVLRFYLPQKMHQLYVKHKVGLGVCTMQGFERRNKESKNTMQRFYNGRGNVLVTNMKRLWFVFKFGRNAS